MSELKGLLGASFEKSGSCLLHEWMDRGLKRCHISYKGTFTGSSKCGRHPPAPRDPLGGSFQASGFFQMFKVEMSQSERLRFSVTIHLFAEGWTAWASSSYV